MDVSDETKDQNKIGSGSFEELRCLPMEEVRESIRAGDYAGHTAGIGLGYLQGNLVILAADYALDFFRFCQRNPKPCPLVACRIRVTQ